MHICTLFVINQIEKQLVPLKFALFNHVLDGSAWWTRKFGDGLKVLCAKPIHRGVFQMTMFEYIFICPQSRHIAMAIPFFPESACEGFFVKKQPLYYIFTPSHLLIYIFTPSHLLIYIFTPSHLLIYIFTPSHLLI